ncbi:MAG: hypothetical protein ACI9ZQ_001701, partial [Porticoccaceae bacterium]
LVPDLNEAIVDFLPLAFKPLRGARAAPLTTVL